MQTTADLVFQSGVLPWWTSTRRNTSKQRATATQTSVSIFDFVSLSASLSRYPTLRLFLRLSLTQTSPDSSFRSLCLLLLLSPLSCFLYPFLQRDQPFGACISGHNQDWLKKRVNCNGAARKGRRRRSAQGKKNTSPFLIAERRHGTRIHSFSHSFT